MHAPITISLQGTKETPSPWGPMEAPFPLPHGLAAVGKFLLCISLQPPYPKPQRNTTFRARRVWPWGFRDMPDLVYVLIYFMTF